MHKLIGLLAAGALSTGAAQAALFSSTPASTAEFSSSSSPIDLQADWSPGQVVLTLPKFNASLGTLTAVNLKFSGQLRNEYSITSAAGASPAVTITPTVGAMSFLLPGSITETLDLLGAPVSLQLDPGTTVSGDFTEGIDGQLRVLLGNLGDFSGPGTFDISVLASAFWDVSTTDDLDDSFVVAFGNAKVQLTYDYTANPNRVPEPSALALVGLALAAAALIRRRA